MWIIFGILLIMTSRCIFVCNERSIIKMPYFVLHDGGFTNWKQH